MKEKICGVVIVVGGITDRRTIPVTLLCINAESIPVLLSNTDLSEKSLAKWNCKKAYDNEADWLAGAEVAEVYKV